MEEQKIITDISYTNKDFQSIYVELLDLVKTLTNKWDPSLSNESDPGVILLKLNALIADKNNYNIDKNVLECFPLSVTQLSNARKLYDLLGYKMNYYNSAETQIYFQVKEKDYIAEGSFIEIPQFTAITDTSGEVVYTLKEAITLTSNSANTPEAKTVIEGRIQEYTINGNSLITINNLDNDLRLYFPERQIAENGIFIKGAEDPSYPTVEEDKWIKVDNLSSYALNNKIYEFGITPDGNSCYIQFPQDISNLMKSGLNINYIISSGINGNIKANTLNSFAEDIPNSVTGEVINDKIRISQPNGTTNGQDPESISSAYKNYKKTIGTFNTLVTERDYENYIYNLKEDNKNLVSNVVVSDRTNDLNYSNHIITKTDITRNKKILAVQDTTDPDKYIKDGDTYIAASKKALNAYDIVLYLLNNPDVIDNKESYDSSFTMSQIDDSFLTDEMTLIQSVQHDIKEAGHVIEGINHDTNAKLLFTNLYELRGSLLTYYKVTENEKKEIEKNVREALYTYYNSHNLKFGTGIEYENLIETIQNSDLRIKTVILDIPSCKPYVLKYYDDFGNPNFISTKREIGMYSNEAKSEYLAEKNIYDGGTVQTFDLNNELIARMILAGNIQLFKFEDDFVYEFGQTNGSIISESKTNPETQEVTNYSYVKSIAGNVDFTIENEYKAIGKNTVIQILEPNLITATEYSSYVSYYFSAKQGNNDINVTIPKNTDYKLKQGEIISISYTDTSGNVINTQIPSGTIINSSIDLTSNQKTVESNPQDKWGKLTSGQSIKIKDYNESILASGTKYYFVLTNPNNTLSIEAGNSYILQENEYFIYTNSASTDMIIYSSGTQITNTSSNDFNVTLQKISLDNLEQTDLSSINWATLINGQQLKLRELLITSLGEGAVIKIDLDTLDISSSVEATPLRDYSDPQQPIDRTIYYKESNTSTTEVTKSSSDIGDILLQTRLILNSQPNSPQQLLTGQSLTVTLCNDVEGQNIYTDDSNTPILITIPDVNDPTAPTTIEFNYPIITTLNETGIDSSVLSSSGYEYLLQLYNYTSQNISDTVGIEINRNNDNTIILSKGVASQAITEITLNYTFEETQDLLHSYLIPVKLNFTNESQSATFSVDGTTLTEFQSTVSSFKSGIFTLSVPNGVTGDTLTISLTQDLGVEENINVGNIFKLNGLNSSEINNLPDNGAYNYNIEKEENGELINFNQILTIMKSIDTNNQFDWTYIVPEEDKVIQPLDANSYWDINHIYNKYIIPKIDFSPEKYNIQVHSTSIIKGV